MKTIAKWTMALVIMSAFGTTTAAPTYYAVDVTIPLPPGSAVPNLTVTGFIATDGTTGLLSPTNILGYSLYDSYTGITLTATGQGGGVYCYGDGCNLVATSSTLALLTAYTGESHFDEIYFEPLFASIAYEFSIGATGSNTSESFYYDDGASLSLVPIANGLMIANVAPLATTLFDFCAEPDCTDGKTPGVQLVQATNGNLYGTADGGTHHDGMIFQITPDGELTTLYNFCSKANCAGGANPSSGLVQATDGNLYGTTGGGLEGAGTVFKITPSGELTTVHSFDGTDGAGPEGVIQAIDGNFYGTTISGGTNEGYGTVFKMTHSGALTTLHTFYAVATSPSRLIQATDGNFYGTTAGGAAPDDNSSVYKITPSGELTTLYSFCTEASCPDGTSPSALMQANDGNLYGTTPEGGVNGDGTVFKITPSGVLTTLYSFCSQTNSQDYCMDGGGADAGLIQATDGNLYGTTPYGGANDYGTVFKITPTGVLTTLYSFCSQTASLDICMDGGDTDASLIQATDGNVYGTTPLGGANNYGTVFSLSIGLGPSPGPGTFVETQTTSGKVGAAVKILGTDLTGATSVTFNGTNATFKVVSASEITTKVPTGATTGTVQVVTPGSTLSSNVVYTVESKTATPVFKPKAGTYTAAQNVSIKDATGGTTIYYTTDGTAPATSSTAMVYAGPIAVSSTDTLKAVALGPDDVLSAVETAEYTIN